MIAATLLSVAMSIASSGMPAQAYVEAPGPAGPLKGTLLKAPNPGAPVVLMVPGSGPIDRDGNGPQGLKPATLKLLAEGLAANGISTVRIDKRGMFASRSATPDPNAVTINDYAVDVHSWIATIRHQAEVKCVWVLGHSEGGLVALAASRDRSGICGLVLVSTAGRPIGAVLREQLRSNPANASILEQAFAAITRLEAGQHVDYRKLSPALWPLFNPAVQDFLIDEMRLDPAKLISSYRGPVLILQGERDIQVSVQDARLLKQANPAAKLVLLPDTNHVLKAVASDDRRANLDTYTDPSLPLAPAVVSSIAGFVKTNSR